MIELHIYAVLSSIGVSFWHQPVRAEQGFGRVPLESVRFHGRWSVLESGGVNHS